MEALKFVWEGAIPLQIHLHESQVTTVPPPPPALILAPRLGYLPLLASQIKPYFSSTLPPGTDSIWFEYKGLPLKWYIPTGVLFDLLCVEPERPWNLTVHFRGYPGNILLPCEGEDSVKWNFINSLKEAAYIINGNCKNVMNMSQADQVELWRSVLNVNLESYTRVSSKLKLGVITNEYTPKLESLSLRSGQSPDETDVSKQEKGEQGKVPVRLYFWSVGDDVDDLEDAPHIDSWDKIAYINQPVEIIQEGKYFSLRDAVRSLLPDYFHENLSTFEELSTLKGEEEDQKCCDKTIKHGSEIVCEHEHEHEHEHGESLSESGGEAEIKLVRIQGIEPKLEIPFSWIANNLMNPDYFLHICICLKVPKSVTTCR